MAHRIGAIASAYELANTPALPFFVEFSGRPFMR